MKQSPKSALDRLQDIPSIGLKVGQMLVDVGISSVEDLQGRSPEELYEKICLFRGEQLDRCVLYHFRCAVYFSTENDHDSKLLKWWSWKDRKI